MCIVIECELTHHGNAMQQCPHWGKSTARENGDLHFREAESMPASGSREVPPLTWSSKDHSRKGKGIALPRSDDSESNQFAGSLVGKGKGTAWPTNLVSTFRLTVHVTNYIF